MPDTVDQTLQTGPKGFPSLADIQKKKTAGAPLPTSTFDPQTAEQAAQHNEWVERPFMFSKDSKFREQSRKGWLQMGSGLQSFLAEILPIVGMPGSFPGTGQMNGMIASEVLKEKARENLKKNNEIYTESGLSSVGAWMPMILGMGASAAASLATGGTSLAAIPAIIGQGTMAAFATSAYGNSILESELYDEKTGHKTPEFQKQAVGLGSGLIMYLAGEVAGAGGKAVNSMIGSAASTVLRENPELASNILRRYLADVPGATQKYLNLAGKIGKNAVKTGGAFSVMTMTQEMLQNLNKYPEDKIALMNVVADGLKSFRDGAFLGTFLGSITAAQNESYNYMRRKKSGITIIQDKDGKVYEQVGDHPTDPNKITVMDSKMNFKDIARENIVDQITMTNGEREKALDAWKSNQEALPVIEQEIYTNNAERTMTSLLNRVAEIHPKTGKPVAVNMMTDVDGKGYFQKGSKVLDDGTYALLSRIERNPVDGSIIVNDKLVRIIDREGRFINGWKVEKTMTPQEFVDMGVDAYRAKKGYISGFAGDEPIKDPKTGAPIDPLERQANEDLAHKTAKVGDEITYMGRNWEVQEIGFDGTVKVNEVKDNGEFGEAIEIPPDKLKDINAKFEEPVEETVKVDGKEVRKSDVPIYEKDGNPVSKGYIKGAIIGAETPQDLYGLRFEGDEELDKMYKKKFPEMVTSYFIGKDEVDRSTIEGAINHTSSLKTLEKIKIILDPDLQKSLDDKIKTLTPEVTPKVTPDQKGASVENKPVTEEKSVKKNKEKEQPASQEERAAEEAKNLKETNPKGLEPYQMTGKQYEAWKDKTTAGWHQDTYKSPWAPRDESGKAVGPWWFGHKGAVAMAIKEGKPVPPEVLKEYPGIYDEVKKYYPDIKPMEAQAEAPKPERGQEKAPHEGATPVIGGREGPIINLNPMEFLMPKLKRLGYSDEDISGMDQKQIQQIVTQNIEKPEVISTVKTPAGQKQEIIDNAEKNKDYELLSLQKDNSALGKERLAAVLKKREGKKLTVRESILAERPGMNRDDVSNAENVSMETIKKEIELHKDQLGALVKTLPSSYAARLIGELDSRGIEHQGENTKLTEILEKLKPTSKPIEKQNPKDFKKGDLIRDTFTGIQYEVIEPDKKGMAKLRLISDSDVQHRPEDWNAYNNPRFIPASEESPLDKMSRLAKEEAESKIDYEGFWKDIKQEIDEPKTREEGIALMKKIESGVEKAGWKFEVDEDPDFASVNVFYKGQSSSPDEMQPTMLKLFKVYSRLLHETHEGPRMVPGGLKSADEIKGEIEEAREDVEPNPTDAQKESGIYPKGHIAILGMDISIETAKGMIRTGTDLSGKKWSVTLNHDYGHILGTITPDGEPLDVYLGNIQPGQDIYVIDQINPDTGQYDEPKVMIGFESDWDARAGYLQNFEPKWRGLGEIKQMPIDQFKVWGWDKANTMKPVDLDLWKEIDGKYFNNEWLNNEATYKKSLENVKGTTEKPIQPTGPKEGRGKGNLNTAGAEGTPERTQGEGKQEFTGIHRIVHDRFAKALTDDYERYKAEYLSKFGNVISGDHAKSLSPDYRNNPTEFSQAVHDPASDFAKKLYDDLIQGEPASEQNNYVVMTAGGTGAGKTTALNLKLEKENPPYLIYDSNMANFETSKGRIEKALENGKEVDILYVWRDPFTAYIEGVIPRMKEERRSIGIDTHVKTSANSLANIRKIYDLYKDNDNVTFTFYDNDIQNEVQPESVFSHIPIDEADLKRRLQDEIKSLQQQGELTETEKSVLLEETRTGDELSLQQSAETGREQTQEINGGEKTAPAESVGSAEQQPSPKPEFAGESIEYRPKDGWETNLIKARDYASHLIDHSEINQLIKDNKLDWTNTESIVAAIKQKLGLKLVNDLFEGKPVLTPEQKELQKFKDAMPYTHFGQSVLLAHKQILKAIPILKSIKVGDYFKSGKRGDAIMPFVIEAQTLGSYHMLFPDPKAYRLIMEHNYIQEGDLMTDPRIDIAVYPSLDIIVPLNFEQSNPPIYQEFIAEGKVIDQKGMNDTLSFMKTWMNNLKNQGRTITESNRIKEETENGTESKSITSIENQASAIINQAENVADREQAGQISEEIDRQIAEIDSQLQLLGEYKIPEEYYRTHEYPHRGLEPIIKKDVTKFSKEIAKLLGWEHDTDRKGKKIEYSNVNLAPAGGDAHFILWKPGTDLGVYVSIPFNPTNEFAGDYSELWKIEGHGQGYGPILWRLTTKAKKYSGMNNQWIQADVTAGELARTIKKFADSYEKSTDKRNFDNINITHEKATTPLRDKGIRDTPGEGTPPMVGGVGPSETGGPVSSEQTPTLPELNGGQSGGEHTEINRSRETAQPGRGGDNTGLLSTDEGRGSSGVVERTQRTDTGNRTQPENLADRNFVITDEAFVPKGEFAKIRANISAIELVQKLEKENRNATPEEKDILAKYTGWGGLATVLDQGKWAEPRWHEEWHKKYGGYHKKLLSLLTPDEFNNAVNSTINAHYTSIPIIRQMWNLAEQLGFRGGNVLESAGGIGHFFGAMPGYLQDNSILKAYELDSITGRIMTKLYPQARVNVKGYELSNEPIASQDLIITNVPFGKTSPFDAKNQDISKFYLHNYFIAKGIRQLKPGGIGVFITSNSSLDSPASAKFREWVVTEGNADFVGAIRLPNNAFAENAGTEVTTDIVIFRKRIGDIISPNAKDFRITVPIGDAETKDGLPVKIEVNQYFAENPDNMLGKMMLAHEAGGGGLYSADRQTLAPIRGKDLITELATRIATMPKSIMETAENKPPEELIAANDEERNGTIVNRGGKIYEVVNGDLALTEWNDKTIKVKGKSYKTNKIADDYLKIKSLANDLITMEQSPDADPKVLETVRANLNKEYDGFFKSYGKINNNKALEFLEDDSEHNAVAALENVSHTSELDKNGRNIRKEFIDKSDIFTKRVNFPVIEPTTAGNVEDALNISISYRNAVDIPYMASILGMTEEQATQELLEEGLVFRNPATEQIEDKDTYLSGFVRTKYNTALEASKDNPLYLKNVEALKSVVPKDIPGQLVKFSLGTPWIPGDMVKQFVKDHLDVNATIEYSNATGHWIVRGHDGQYGAKNKTAGTEEFSGLELVEKSLNLRTPRVVRTSYDYVDGRRVKTEKVDIEATAQAQGKMDDIMDTFVNYVYDKPEYVEQIETVYNAKYNDFIEKNYNAPSFDHFPGASKDIKLYGIQRVGVMRSLKESTLLAMQVGTGKTFTMITTAMEMRRLKLAKKPMIVVQNSTLEQFSNSFRELYPAAKILVPPPLNKMKAEKRQLIFNKIAYGDWDSIIIPQSFLDFIPDDPARERAYIQERIAELQQVLDEVDDGSWNNPIASDLKKSIEALNEQMFKMDNPTKKKTKKVKDIARSNLSKETQLEKQAFRRKDDVRLFEKMGVDALFVDEAHAYKKLGFATALQNIKGIDTKGSKRAFGLYMKVKFVQEKMNGRNVILSTGTPISNTMAEVWTMMKYIAPEILKKHNINTFDQFASTFGSIEPSLEFTAAGKFKVVKRFKSYKNAPELMRLFRANSYVVLTEDVPEFKEAKTIPKLKDGKHTQIIIPQSEGVKTAMEKFKNILEAWEQLPGKEKRLQRHVPLVIFGRAKQAAIDLRLINSANYDDPGSKTNEVVKQVKRIYDETTSYKGTQLVFSDIFQSPDLGSTVPRFNLYEDIRDKLMKLGVPATEIVIIKDQSGGQREAIYDRVNKGEVRIVLGSTGKLGTGVNVQDLLKAIHHIDAPIRPMDFEQRNGRILRQGNQHADMGLPVEVVTYGVEKTLDATAFQRLDIKMKFINQMMKGDKLDREANDAADEEDATDMTFAQMMATLSGSQYAILHTQKMYELKKLQTGRRNYERGMIDAKKGLQNARTIVGYLTDALMDVKNATELIRKYFKPLEGKGEGTTSGLNIKSITFNGKQYQGEKLLEGFNLELTKMIDLFKAGVGENKTSILKINDIPVPIFLSYDGRNDRFVYQVEPVQSSSAEAKITGYCTSGAGFFQSLKIQFNNFLDGKLKDVEKRLAQHQNDIPTFENTLTKKFAQQEKLDNTEREVRDLEEKMKEETENGMNKNPKPIVTPTRDQKIAWLREQVSNPEHGEKTREILTDYIKQYDEAPLEATKDLILEEIASKSRMIKEKFDEIDASKDNLLDEDIEDSPEPSPSYMRRPKEPDLNDENMRPIWDNAQFPKYQATPGTFAGEEVAVMREHEMMRRAQIMSEYTGVPIIIVRTKQELPKHLVKDAIKRFGDLRKSEIPSVYDRANKKVYLVVEDNKSVSDLVSNMSHEVFAHYGLEALLGVEPYLRVLQLTYTGMSPVDVVELANRYNVPESDWKTVAEEYIGYIAGNGQINPNLWQRIIAYIRNLIRKILNISMSKSEIMALLKKAKDNLTNNKPEVTDYANIGDYLDALTAYSTRTGKAEGGFGYGIHASESRAIEEAIGKGNQDYRTYFGVAESQIGTKATGWIEKALANNDFDSNKALDYLESKMTKYQNFERHYRIVKDARNYLFDNEPKNPTAMYKVLVGKGKAPDELNFLSWDKPIDYDQQENIVNQLDAENKFDITVSGAFHSGEALYNKITDLYGSDREASLFLSRAGIDGMKKDQSMVIYDNTPVDVLNQIAYMRRPKSTFVGEHLANAGKVYTNQAETKRNWQETVNGIREYIQDNNLPVRKFEEEIIKRGGLQPNDAKPYRDISLSFGRQETLYKDFMKTKMKPIQESVAKIIKGGMSGENILPYIISKHAIERNMVFRAREIDEFIMKNPDATDQDIAELKEEIADKDYSGVMAFDVNDEFTNPDELAQTISDEFEEQVSKPLIDELWSNIHNASSAILDIWEAGQQLSPEQKQMYLEQFKYFVPLRGWREGAAKDLVYVKGEGFKKSLMHATGRKSLADNPLAYMQSVAFSAIGEQVDNEVKTSMLRLLMRNLQSADLYDLATVKKLYYIRVDLPDGTHEWEPTLDRPSQELFDSGEAVTKIYNEYQKLRVPKQAREHEVIVRRQGGDVVMIFKGKMLSVAQAMNKRNFMYHNIFSKVKDARTLNQAVTGLSYMNNFLKAAYTSWNIVFPFTNFLRDVQEASMTQLIRGDAGQKIVVNYHRAFPSIIRFLRDKLDMNNPDDVKLRDFYLTGGATGFTHLLSAEDLEKDLMDEINRMVGRGTVRGDIKHFMHESVQIISMWNQVFEDATRFSVYLTSIDLGKTKEEAASDAKEASVNFNRKGKSSKLYDSIYAFWNVAWQSLQKNFKLGKDYPKRFAAVASAFMALGFLEALLNHATDDQDPENDYYNINPYMRENYLVLPNLPRLISGESKGNKYLSIPLPQFWRGFKSIGSLAYDLTQGKTTVKEAITKAMLNFGSAMSPVDIGGFSKTGEFSLAPIVPTIIKPFYEIATNRNYMGYTIAREPFDKAQKKLLANSGLGKSNVNPAAKFFTDMLFRWGGGENATKYYIDKTGEEKKVPGFLDINPSFIEHLFKGYTGGSGAVFSDLITTISQALKPDQEVDFKNIPFVNKFLRETPESKWNIISDYYNLKDVVGVHKGLKRAYQQQAEAGGSTTGIEATEGSNYYQQYQDIVDSYDKDIKEISDQVDFTDVEGTKPIYDLMQQCIVDIKALKEQYKMK